jgi:hypothetical protein
MINKKSISIICLSTDKPIRSLEILNHCKNIFPYFDKCILFANENHTINDIEIKKVNVPSYQEYNRFIVEDLNNYIFTDFTLIVQEDGYIINPELWNENFLKYDYIGAMWPNENICGNGGFCLRSKKFLELSSKLKYSQCSPFYDITPEDWFLCSKNRKYFLDNNIKFGESNICDLFSKENNNAHLSKETFGFHEKLN